MARIRLAVSTDAGAAWDEPEIIASDAADDAVPALVVDRFDTLGLWYHDQTDRMRCRRSEDYGETWVDVLTLAGPLNWPRPALCGSRLLVAVHRGGTALGIYRSDDFGATVESVVTLSGVPEQPVMLRADRREVLHLTYLGADQRVYHRRSEDYGETWQSATVLVASADAPGYAVGLERALLAWFDGEALRIARTDEGYAGTLTSGTAPAGVTYDPQRLALLWDHREQLYLFGRDNLGNARLFCSRDGGDTWAVPS